MNEEIDITFEEDEPLFDPLDEIDIEEDLVPFIDNLIDEEIDDLIANPRIFLV